MDIVTDISIFYNLVLLQDDYRVCMDFNIIQKDSVPVCPVDVSGCFTAEVTDFAGQYVKVSESGDSKLLLYSR